MDAILRLADVPHSVISTGSSSTDSDQQQRRPQPAAQARVERRRPPRGPASSPRRRASGNSNYRSGIRPLSTDTHTNLRTAAAVRSATISSLCGQSSRLSYRTERSARTLDRLERTASDFDVCLLVEKSTSLPKSDGRGSLRRRGLKGGHASDGDDIDAPAGRLSGKRRTRFRFKNIFRSTEKSSDASKVSGRKTAGRKLWENCV